VYGLLYIAVGVDVMRYVYTGATGMLWLWGGVWLAWQGRRLLARVVGRWWRTLVVVLVLGSLQGCVQAHRQIALWYGCDPVAIDQGYCTMPKGGQ
jgi:hypothetical protein